MRRIYKTGMVLWGMLWLLLFAGPGICGEPLVLTPVDKVVILELYGDNTYPAGKSDAIVTRLGDTRSTGKGYPPLASHGMGILVEITVGGKKHTILFDAGERGDVLRQNFTYFGKNPADIEAIAVSHGHSDHFGGLPEALNMIRDYGNSKKIPIYTGSTDAFDTRYVRQENGDLKGPWRWPKEAIELLGGEHVVGGPHLMLNGLALYTGSIPYLTSYENIDLNSKRGWCIKDKDGNVKMIDMPEEGALVINLKNRGLVVISGCTHRGTVNTLKYAQQLTGINTVYARYGSFQKADKDKLLNDLAVIKPAIFIGTHCSLDKPELVGAIKSSQSANGGTYYQSSMGSEFKFSAE